MDARISDDELHAYVDEQLMPKRRYELARVIRNSPELLKRVRELRLLKSLLRSAYSSELVADSTAPGE